MAIERVHSWRALDEAVTDTSWCCGDDHAHSPLVFRGLARASYTNRSSLARLEGDYAALERHLLRNFRKYAHREAAGPTTWDWLSLAQHHGVPTRLLDWTYSPLVALHFATASAPEEDAVLWAVDAASARGRLPAPLRDAVEREGSLVFTTDLLAAHAHGLEALAALEEDGPFLVFFEPPSLDERIINQAALLSVLSDPTAHMDGWLRDRPEAWRAWRIPPPVKAEIRERLDQANVTERVLLGGLDGLAAWLRRYYTPGRRMTASAEGGGAMDSGRDDSVGGASMERQASGA